jgi:uncharacterized cysteine cluster protein YcgN (CxxCxxCC family)
MEEYGFYQDKKLREYEALCRRCGSCCGIKDGDPCEHLRLTAEGKSFCDIYENRFGLRRTRSGREFYCVPIRKILSESWSGSYQCAYKKVLP